MSEIRIRQSYHDRLGTHSAKSIHNLGIAAHFSNWAIQIRYLKSNSPHNRRLPENLLHSLQPAILPGSGVPVIGSRASFRSALAESIRTSQRSSTVFALEKSVIGR